VTTAKQHYDELLGDHYTWSVAGSGDPFAHGAAWLAEHRLLGFERYLDLGAGFGAHVVPLARAGKHVTAVDFHAGLLAELRAAAPSVATHEADLVAFLESAASPLAPTWEAAPLDPAQDAQSGPRRDAQPGPTWDVTSPGPTREVASLHPAQEAQPGPTPNVTSPGPTWDVIQSLEAGVMLQRFRAPG
jgi:SAM-dependent methyltransferase